MTKNHGSVWPTLFREALPVGIVAGLLYFVVNLVLFFPTEQLGLMQSGFLKFNLFAYSLSIWVLAFAVLSILVHLVTYPLRHSRRGGAAIVGRFVTYFVIAIAFLAGHAVWMGYANQPPMVPSYIKVQAMKTAVMWAVLLAVLAGIVLALATGRRRAGRPKGAGTTGGLIAMVVLFLIYAIVLNLPFDYARLSDEQGGPYPGRSRTVILGVDAGSWDVVLPFVQAGELPTFKKLMDTGTYGHFDTYGQQYTPPSWTSIATGKSEDRHGVHTFANVSTDWKAAPIWSIMSSAGKKVGVVNWVCTWPPFDVRGGFISKIADQREGSVHFSQEFAAYGPLADSVLSRWDYHPPRDDQGRLEQAENEMLTLSRINAQVYSKMDLDLAAYVYYSTDLLQHFFWLEMAPDRFRGRDWTGESPELEHSEAVKEVWLNADRLLSELMQTYGEYATYLVVSDHGSRPIKRRQVTVDMVALLEGLGYLTTWEGDVRRETSTCYPVEGGSNPYRFDIEINPAEYVDGGQTDQALYDQLRTRIAGDLKAVRLENSHTPAFREVLLPDKAEHPDAPDLRLVAGRSVMEMPPQGTAFIVGDKRIEADRVLHFHPWSGRHRARGLILAAGPGIKNRYAGAWTVDDPYTLVFRYGHGIYKVLDRVSGPLCRLHLVDEVMNIDVAPTLLYLEHLPVARDMDGRVLTEMFERDFRASNPLETVETYRAGETLNLQSDPDAERRIKQRLKALGYIQ